MKTSELTGTALDWAVAKCEGLAVSVRATNWRNENAPHLYSSDWALGGPIIEREKIDIAYGYRKANEWTAFPLTWTSTGGVNYGPTPLIAAMRCYVASRLGDDVEVPEELK